MKRIRLDDARSLGLSSALGDVAFLLLVFMITMMNSSSNNQVTLPDFRNSEIFQESDVEVLSLTKQGMISFRDRSMSKEEAIELLLEEREEKLLQFYVDKDTKFIDFINIVDFLKNHGNFRVALMSKPRKEEEQGVL